MAKTKQETVYQGRVKILQKRIKGWAADALLVTNPKDIRYLTGFCGEDSWALVLAKSAKVFVFSDSRFDVQIDREAPQVKKVIRSDKGLVDEVALVCEKKGLAKVGLQGNYVTLSLKQLLDKKLTKKRLVMVEDGMIIQRSYKNADEIKDTRRAVKIQEAAYLAMVDSLRAGQTELEICAKLEYEMKMRGGGTWFSTDYCGG